MPARLRPTAAIAAEAILVGDPGRALMLAQELLEEPKMSNHARGLWGYTGTTEAGRELTIQSTGMGGPSASVVLADLAELGVRRAVRIGTCASLGSLALGQLVVVNEAREARGAFASPEATKATLPDPRLSEALRERLPEARAASVLSLDNLYRPERDLPSTWAEAADMQTAALLGAAEALGVAAAAVLVVTEKSDSGQLPDEELEGAAKAASRAASVVL
ncbi:MAG: purine-nucleoside phosphorylase [Solirubrobacterales bacterium]|jgi:uridine phosphorylase|nr:purine-nucleoside phosphorylase [Solirubrobacterales bacterium]